MKYLYRYTTKTFFFLCLLFFFGIFQTNAADYGVKPADIPAMKNIQNQLTEQFLDSTQNSLAIQKTEEKMLDSKIEGLMLEDIISGYDSDIALLDEQILPLFEQLREPKQRISDLEERKNNIKKSLSEEGKILSNIYLEMLFRKQTENKAIADSLLANLFVNQSEELAQQITEESLKKMEQKSMEKYIALLKEFTIANNAQKDIEKSITDLNKKYTDLNDQRDKIEQQKAMKEEQLTNAKEKKEHYEDILQESKDQAFASMEEAMSSDSTIVELQKKLEALEQTKDTKEAKETANRLKNVELKEEYSPEELTTDMLAAISKKVLDEAKDSAIFAMWPVEPNKGISATFHDTDYKKRFGMQHNAIDIPAPQGSNIVAPADGYVYKTVDNGLGYSYIIILHRNNLRTVYGHVSGFEVAPGQMVTAGQVIGRVGGTPGTRGAGKMTTGAHLHFEVLVNEVYKNPINYLPAR